MTLSITESTTQTEVRLSAPAGTYYAGQSVPITAAFDYPLEITDAMTLTVNGEPLHPEEAGSTAESCTFLYPVDKTSGATLNLTGAVLSGTGANGQPVTVTVAADSSIQVGGAAAEEVELEALRREDAFAAYELAVSLQEETNQPILLATISLAAGSAHNWVLQELEPDRTLNALQILTSQTGEETFSFRVDNPDNPTALIASIPLPYNTSTEAMEGEVDFLLDGAVMMGRGLTYTVEGSIPVRPEDMHPTLTVTPSAGGAPVSYEPDDDVPVVYIQQGDSLTLDFELDAGSYTWGDPNKISYYKEDGQLADETAHFAWKSSDPDIARISVDDKGTATVTASGRAGRVELVLVALNDALADTESDPIEVTFDVGQDPFLLIPELGQDISIREGQNAVVNWSSNLCQKNETAGEGGALVPTTFSVRLYSRSGDSDASRELVWSADLTTTEENPSISSAVIPWAEALQTIYQAGKRSATVEISAQYDGEYYGTYENETGSADTATAVIEMVSQPASVTLEEPAGGLYQTDGGGKQTITLNWKLDHLDAISGGQFELYVASTNEDFATGGILSVPDLAVGNAGTYTLDIPAVVLSDDPTSYRDTYTVTVKAKNAAESTWAYSSYVLYVYSEDALRILLDGGADAGSSLRMSNEEKIAELWGAGGETGSEAIVALQRDIALKHVVSANYGQYAWAELADQIAWNSSDSSVASINYQQGTLYENIENFSYTSYRPTTDFILSGLKDGTTTIKATHVKTGITDSVTVEVDTLRDQLYLFQCYPKAVTTLTYSVYTDAERTAVEQMTLDTNADGEAAVYAPYGIAGDVYCKSSVEESGETVTYLGTIYNRSLVSSEADSTKLQLYPVNTLQLRRAAQAEIYLKNPDGTPYAKQEVTFRGGVYRDGEYCMLNNVQFGLQEADRDQWQLGNKKQTAVTDEQGRLLVTMDLSQFKTRQDQGDIQAGERLHYIFQLDYGDGTSAERYPLFLRVDADLNLNDVIATGEHIVFWEDNPSGQTGPYIAQQTLQYSDSSRSSVMDMRNKTGAAGPSTTFPNAWLTTTVMWWGDEQANAPGRVNSVHLQDSTGKIPEGQSCTATVYPFTDVAFTEHVIKMDEAGMENWGISPGEKRTVQMALSKDGTTVDTLMNLPFQVVNMIGVPNVADSDAIFDTIDDIEDNVSVDAGNSSALTGGDALIQGGLELLAGDAEYDSSQDSFAVRLFATNDPTVFRAFFCANAGNMGSDENATGVYPQYTDAENAAFLDTDSAAKPGDADLLPNPINIYKMAKGTFMDSMTEDAGRAVQGKGVRGFNMDLGGYFEADIAYNSETGQWECIPISGGFHVGGGVNYSWFVNAIVGIIPVNISLTLGCTLELSMDTQRGHYYHVSNNLEALNSATTEAEFQQALAQADYTEQSDMDYLTQLRIFLYIRAFAGIGFDISVLACKIGVFGQLNGDFNFSWLNRSYLESQGNYSAVGPVDSRRDSVMAGQEPRFSGSTGIEFVFKFLFISYEKIFCSIGFEVGGQYGDQETIDEIWAANKTINNSPVQRLMMPNGQYLYAVDLGAQLENRSYVDASPQLWVGGMAMNALDLDENSGVAEALQTGAYSYANPVVSDDGQVMFYLSDRENGDPDSARDVTNTRVAVSCKQGDVFPEGERLNGTEDVPEGYGDSSVKLAGSSENGYAAVWVRQMENITPEDTDQGGGTLTDGQQMLQMNSTEIVAATSENGENWTLHRLTNNKTPDLAPVVATNGTRTVAAWREVNSTSTDNLTSFDQQDTIRYAVYENGVWSDTQTLYDGTGTGATVKGIEAAMMENGTTAVIYTLDTNAANGSSNDWETVMAIIPGSAASETRDGETVRSQDTVRTFQLTSDSDLDENPQITTILFEDGEERFVAAWHTERAVSDSDETESDIRLVAMDGDGVVYENMPESLGRATEGTGETVGSNFRFAKNADSMEELAILWVDSEESGETADRTYDNLEEGVSSGYTDMGQDILKAVRFVENGNSFTVSGTAEVARMPQDTLIDHFDAYVDSAVQVKSVILGTNYSQTTTRSVEISDGTESGTKTVEMTVADPVTGMYTAAAEFENRFELPAVMLEYDKLYPNSDIDVQFTVRNSGVDAISKLEIYADGQPDDPVYTSGETLLNLLPNRDLTVTAQFPTGAAIENTGYTVKAMFDSGETVESTDTLYLDIPDVGISKVETIREQDGERTLRYSLYNLMSAKLADETDDWRVRIGFYADQSCTTPLKDENGTDLVSTIQDQDGLALIDAGAYSGEVALPVNTYMTDENGVTQEIPAGGITVYVKAWLEAPVADDSVSARSGQDYGEVTEYYDSNNTTSTTLDNLALRRGEDVTLKTELDNSGDVTKVSVDVQYNKLTGTASGNLIVTLLDENGLPLETLQSYSDGNQLLILSKENSTEETFTFSQKGASVRVTFSDLILHEDSVELDHVSLTGATVTYDPETRTYTAAGTELTSGILEIAPKDPANADVTFNGDVYDVSQPKTIPLPYGTTVWEITVTNGGNQATYSLVLNNENLSSGGGSGGNSGGSASRFYDVEVSQEITHGSVTVDPETARRGQTVTIHTTPEDGYKVGTVTVYRTNGDTVSVSDQGNGTYTFVMPSGAVEVQITFVPESEWSNPFSDVPADAWYFDGVRYAAEHGLMGGYSTSLFGPDDHLTRAQLVQILYTLEGRPNTENENLGYPFADVPGDSWFADAVYWARLHGIVSGYSAEQFGPNDSITREQMATILYNYAEYKGHDTSAGTDLSGYDDVGEVSSWALTAMAWANAEGMISGTSSAALSPRSFATRAQTALILMRYCENIMKQ